MAEELTQEKMYTQEEVDKLLQSEADKRVSEALKKQEKKLEERQRLALMNEQEKYEYELKQREEALAERERKLALAEMKNETVKILADKGLSIDFADLVVDTDAAVVQNKIAMLEKAF